MNYYQKTRVLEFFNKFFKYNIFNLFVVFTCIILTSQNLYSKEIEWVFVEKKEGIELFECKEQVDGIAPFKARTILNIPHETIVKVLTDTEKKPDWAPKLKKTKIHHQLSTNQFVYSEYYSVPFPFFDREFCLLGTIRFEGESVLFIGEDYKKDHKPAKNHVLANINKLEFKITPKGNEKTEIEFTFIGDMGGAIPQFVINIIQRRWPVKFLLSLSEYIAKNHNFESERYLKLSKGTQKGQG